MDEISAMAYSDNVLYIRSKRTISVNYSSDGFSSYDADTKKLPSVKKMSAIVVKNNKMTTATNMEISEKTNWSLKRQILSTNTSFTSLTLFAKCLTLKPVGIGP